MVGTGSMAGPIFMAGTSSEAATSGSSAMDGSSGMASIHTRTIRTRITRITRITRTTALRTTFHGGSSPSSVAGDITVVIVSHLHASDPRRVGGPRTRTPTVRGT